MTSGEQNRFELAIRRFDQENSADPNQVVAGNASTPREVWYAGQLTAWVLKLCPEASEALRLAARGQHLCRWMLPRNRYPMTRAGYLQWRAELKHFHAGKAAEILKEIGYSEAIIERVRALNLKKNLADPECQILEDALCLLFLDSQFSELAGKTAPEKMIQVLRKTWKKMSAPARAQARLLSFGEREKILLHQAQLPE